MTVHHSLDNYLVKGLSFLPFLIIYVLYQNYNTWLVLKHYITLSTVNYCID